MNDDMVEHPAHYTQHPSGVECIEITQQMESPNLSNAFKYAFRHGLKGDWQAHLQDLRKADFYIRQQMELIRNEPPTRFDDFLEHDGDPLFEALIRADQQERGKLGNLSKALFLLDEKTSALRGKNV